MRRGAPEPLQWGRTTEPPAAGMRKSPAAEDEAARVCRGKKQGLAAPKYRSLSPASQRSTRACWRPLGAGPRRRALVQAPHQRAATAAAATPGRRPRPRARASPGPTSAAPERRGRHALAGPSGWLGWGWSWLRWRQRAPAPRRVPTRGAPATRACASATAEGQSWWWRSSWWPSLRVWFEGQKGEEGVEVSVTDCR